MPNPSDHEMMLLSTLPEGREELIEWLSSTLKVVSFVAGGQLGGMDSSLCGELMYMLHSAMPRIKLLESFEIDCDEDIVYNEDSGSHIKEATVLSDGMQFNLRRVGTEPVEIEFDGDEPDDLKGLMLYSCMLDRVASVVVAWN